MESGVDSRDHEREGVEEMPSSAEEGVDCPKKVDDVV